MKGVRVEELTEDEFESLSDEEKSKYLELILGPFEDFGYSSDFDEDDLLCIASGEDRALSEASSDSDDSGISAGIQDGNSNESGLESDKENRNLGPIGDNQHLISDSASFAKNEDAVNYTDIVEDLYSIIGNLVDGDDQQLVEEKENSNTTNEQTRPVLTTINLKDIEWQSNDDNSFKTQGKLTTSDAFKRIFTTELVDAIIRCTNDRAKAEYAEYNQQTKRKQIVWRDLTRREFYSFLGILIAAGANNANSDSSMDMWKITSYPLYRATMSLNRFWNTLRFMRFDEPKTRSRNDKLGSIRRIWSMLNANLAAAHPRPKTTANLTVRDQLFPFKGVVNGLAQYNPSKPAKYGIRIWWVCDSSSFYPLHGEIDTGSQNRIATRRHHHRAKPNQKPDRITGVFPGDGFFTTFEGLEKSVTNDPKRNVMDVLLRRFTTHRRTIKCSMALFFNLLDVATFASYVLYHEENRIAKSSSTQRKSYMRQLSEELCLPTIEERARDHQALKNFSTRLAIECVLGKPVDEFRFSEPREQPRGPKPIVGCCYYCFNTEDKRRRKTRQTCSDCARPVCSGHSRNFVKCSRCKLR